MTVQMMLTSQSQLHLLHSLQSTLLQCCIFRMQVFVFVGVPLAVIQSGWMIYRSIGFFKIILRTEIGIAYYDFIPYYITEIMSVIKRQTKKINNGRVWHLQMNKNGIFTELFIHFLCISLLLLCELCCRWYYYDGCRQHDVATCAWT